MKKNISNLIILFGLLLLSTSAYSQVRRVAPIKKETTTTVTNPNPTLLKSTNTKQDSAKQKYIPQRLEIIYAGDMSDDLFIKESNNSKKIAADEEFEEDEGTLSEADILYAGFDTSAIHYPKFDFSNKQDTTKILLVSGKSVYVHPVRGHLTSEFGPRRRRYHYGNDVDLNTGDPIVSAFDGVVRIAKKNKTYGNLVVIRHDNGLETFYAHLSALEAIPEQRVKAGDLIGLGGNTGRSRGSHLHFEIRYLGAAINPNDVINFSKFCLLSDTLVLTKDNFGHQKSQSNTQLASSKAGGAKGTTSGKSTRYYKVRKGDTLGAIAARNGTTIKALCKINGIKKNKTLAVGKSIRVK